MILRLAHDGDKRFFQALRNDPDTVRFSWSKRMVSDAEHDAWWQTTPDARFVAEADGERVGVLRITQLDEYACEVHLTVAPDQRGMGFAGKMLEAGRVEARERGYGRIVARVDSPNTASLRAFLRAGYAVTSPGTVLLECEV